MNEMDRQKLLRMVHEVRVAKKNGRDKGIIKNLLGIDDNMYEFALFCIKEEHGEEYND